MKNIQMVVFAVGKEDYGIDISCAQEIIRIPKNITRVPNMPSFIEGMLNLRDQVIPVVDLRKRFGLENTETENDSRLLILNLEGMLLGNIVDDVSEVLSVGEESIESLYVEIAHLGNNCIKGICKVEDRLIMLLDVTKLKNEIFASVS
ncbi:chemotaxis protein CheW [Dehalobacter sp. 4CP]|uniref:chemotaxis protein CheW n=1 Tax=Dehalobacter sp. CP TaxID=2594474 RepID=UPI0039E89EA8|nr:chemotaxis protein CheW [Dehalobacter sp.]